MPGEFLSEYAATIGMDVLKDKIIDKMDRHKLRELIEQYLDRKQIENYNCTLEEEIDFEGFCNYARNEMIEDIKKCVFSASEKQKILKTDIMNKSIHYAMAGSKISKQRVEKLTSDIIDILINFYRTFKTDSGSLLLVGQIECKLDNMLSDMGSFIEEVLETIHIEHTNTRKVITDSLNDYQLAHFEKLQLLKADSEVTEELLKKLSSAFDWERDRNPSFRSIEFDRGILPDGSILDAYTTVTVDMDPSSMTLNEFLQFSWKAQKRHLSLFGIGGLGKTIALLSLDCTVPMVYVPLRTLVDFSDDTPIKNYIKDSTFHSDSNAYNSFIMLSEMDWMEKPRMLLLLDGVNELPLEKRRILLREIDCSWINKRGLQIIIASRYDVSAEIRSVPFCRLKLDALSPEKIRAFLQKTEVAIPAQSSRLWNVINTPLMLSLYAKSEILKQKYSHAEILWRENINPGAIIWNYLQSEIYKYQDAHGDVLSCAVAAEFIAPYISYQMQLRQQFIIQKKEFRTLVYEAFELYRLYVQRDQLPDHLEAVIQTVGSSEVPKERFYALLTQGMCLFQEAGDSVQLIHQHFRDCFAAIHLFRLAETSSGGIPDEWKEPFDQYVADFLADLLQTEGVTPDNGVWGKIWGNDYKFQADAAFIIKMLNLYRRSYGNNLSAIDFSGLNLTDVSFTGCRLSNNSGHFRGTQLSRNTFVGPGHQMTVSSVSWRKDNQFYLTASYDCTIRIWNAAESVCEILEPFHTLYIRCAQWNPVDNTLLASSGDDRCVVCWKRGTDHKWVPSVLGHCDDWTTSLAWSPDGQQLVCGDRSGGVKLFRLDGYSSKNTQEHLDYIRHVAWFSCEKNCFATGSDDGVVCIWNSEQMTLKCKLSFELSRITSVQWVNHGDLLAVSDRSCLYVLDPEKQEKRLLLSRNSISFMTSSSHNEEDYYALFFQGFVEILKGHLENGQYELCSVAAREMDTEITNQIVCAEWSSDCQELVCGSRDGSLCKIRVFVEEDSSERIMLSLVAEKSPRSARCSSWAFGGRRLAVGYDDSRIRIWDVDQKRCIKVLAGHKDSVKCIAWSPDNRYIVSGSDDSSIRIWNLEHDSENETVIEKKLHTGPVNCILWLKSGHIISGSDDKTLRFWEFAKDKMSPPLPGHTKRIYSISVSPDETHIVSGGNDKELRLWDLFAHTCLQKVDSGHTEPIRGLAWSADGKTIFSASNDNTLICRDFDNKTIRIMDSFQQLSPEHKNFIYSVAVSGNGKYVVTGSTDTDVVFWDTQKRQLIGKGSDHVQFIWNVSASKEENGKCFVASSSSDGTVRIWDVTKIETQDIHSVATLQVLPNIDIVDCNLSQACIDSDELKDLLIMNGGVIS